ncbi:MAG: response regulator transcription factor [Flavobacteriales bacterium]|nr:response regulator transcription factor [Flavobacteriales bacterium]
MIKAVLIDDEKDARFILRNLLERKFSDKIEVIGEADDVIPGAEAIEALKPDLVFLDVQMKKGNGFDLLNRLDDINFEVIFITAHNQFAVEAFKFSAFGYLLKPVKHKDLGVVIEKLETKLLQSKNKMKDRLKVLVENYGNEGEVQKLILPNVEGFQVVKVGDIIRLEGDRNYTNFILLGGKKITASKNLGEYEELLNPHGFFRIHQSTIVSLRHISSYLKTDGGIVETVDGAKLKVSRYRKTEFLSRFF